MSFYSGSAMPTPERVYFLDWNQPVIHVPPGELIASQRWLIFTVYPKPRPLTRSHQNKYYRHRKGIRR